MLTTVTASRISNTVIQAKIEYEKGKYIGKGRLGFKSKVDEGIIANQSGLLKKPIKHVNYAAEGKARCHNMDYHFIQEEIVKFLNESTIPKNKNNAINNFNAFMGVFTEGNYDASGDRGQVRITSAFLINHVNNGKDVASITKLANELLSQLNSYPENLRPGNGRINSTISKRPDLEFIKKEDGTFSLTPLSRRYLKYLIEIKRAVPTTPRRGRRSMTSNGPLDPRKMSPNSKLLFDNAYTLKMNINSKKVDSMIYGANEHFSFSQVGCGTGNSTTADDDVLGGDPTKKIQTQQIGASQNNGSLDPTTISGQSISQPGDISTSNVNTNSTLVSMHTTQSFMGNWTGTHLVGGSIWNNSSNSQQLPLSASSSELMKNLNYLFSVFSSPIDPPVKEECVYHYPNSGKIFKRTKGGLLIDYVERNHNSERVISFFDVLKIMEKRYHSKDINFHGLILHQTWDSYTGNYVYLYQSNPLIDYDHTGFWPANS